MADSINYMHGMPVSPRSGFPWQHPMDGSAQGMPGQPPMSNMGQPPMGNMGQPMMPMWPLYSSPPPWFMPGPRMPPSPSNLAQYPQVPFPQCSPEQFMQMQQKWNTSEGMMAGNPSSSMMTNSTMPPNAMGPPISASMPAVQSTPMTNNIMSPSTQTKKPHLESQSSDSAPNLAATVDFNAMLLPQNPSASWSAGDELSAWYDLSMDSLLDTILDSHDDPDLANSLHL